MTIPALVIALMIALAYGALYHLLRDGGVWRLFFYAGLSVIGFALGHLIGLWRGWVFFPVGALNLGMSSVGSLAILILGDWLSRIEPNQESTV
jgi:hypothetical protein